MLQINTPYSSNITPSLFVTSNPDIPSLSTAPTSSDHPSPNHPLPTPLPTAPVLLPTSSNDSSPSLPPTVPTVTVANQHPMKTRSKSGIVKPKLCYKAILDYTKLNLLLIKWPPNILCGVLLWTLSFRHYKGNRHGYWF